MIKKSLYIGVEISKKIPIYTTGVSLVILLARVRLVLPLHLKKITSEFW